MKIVIYFLVFTTALLINGEEEDDKVLTLTTDNFQDTIDSTEFILVEFYAPWCGHCQALAPEYSKAAAQLAEAGSAIKLGKVDATQHMELAEKHEVRGYPTLKFFKNGSPIDYAGGRTSDKIVEWVNKKTGPPAKELSSVEEAKSFVSSASVVVIGFFKDKDSNNHKEYFKAAGGMDDFQFGVTYDSSVMKEYDVSEDSVILFKDFDEGKVVYDAEIESSKLSTFMIVNSIPILVEFTHETASKIFAKEIKHHLLVFLSKEAGHFDKTEPLKAIAKKFKSKILFVSIDADLPDNARIMEYFGMDKEKEVPGLRIITFDGEQGKYKPDFEGTDADKVESFVQDYLDGKLKAHLLSQELPEDWDKNPVKQLVAKNFDEVAFDKEKDVLVEFYAPWCGHCKQLAPIYDELGEKFKDSVSVLIAKMDATVNELEHTKIESFPTLKLYKKETNEIIEYNGERTLDGLSKFLETGGEYGKAADGAEVDEEEEDEDAEAPMKDEL